MAAKGLGIIGTETTVGDYSIFTGGQRCKKGWEELSLTLRYVTSPWPTTASW